MSYNFDPELRDLIALLPDNDFSDPPRARAGMRGMMKTANSRVDSSSLAIEEKLIPGYEGGAEVRVRLYRPLDANAPLPCILQIHGGGFVLGDLDSEHATSVALAKNISALVVSVDYRLAPEHPFPAALQDCFATLQWIHENAESLGINSERVAVYGQSAGGGLAAALTIMARDRKLTNAAGGPALCFQFLGMPELDDRLTTTSQQQFVDTPIWSRRKAELSWRYYLGEDYQPGADNVPELAAPARAANLKNLPPAYISAMEFDPLRDEDLLYALKLLEAGNAVELHTFPGTFHGSALAAGARISKRQAKEMFVVLERALRA